MNFYDGQGFVVKRDTKVDKIAGLNGATVCVAQGTTHEVTLGDYARAHNITWQPVVFERVDTMYQAFFSGRCDAMTQDASALAGAVATAAPNPADYLVLSETISKEPLGPFTRNGDEAWSNLVAWVHYGLVEAEELGVTAANADEQAKSEPEPGDAAPARHRPASSARVSASITSGCSTPSRRSATTAKSSTATSAPAARSSSAAGSTRSGARAG